MHSHHDLCNEGCCLRIPLTLFKNRCPAINSLYSKPERQNAMLASHCKERYACEAFDYDWGRCNKAFFDTVCNTSASIGASPSYPRRFSDMSGFEWFRRWPHSFADSCALSPKLTRLKTADGRLIGVQDFHRLRALCHLYTRCVREHPANCEREGGGECPPTPEARLRAEYAAEDLDTFWSMGISTVSHAFQFGGVILLPAAVFMFFLVATEMASVHASASQYLIALEVAQQERKPDKTPKCCCSNGGVCAARFLLYLARDYIVISVLNPTIMSVTAVSTSFDIIFCGAIAVTILQADQQVFSTIMTDASFNEMVQEFSLVLTKSQHARLKLELTVVFWSAFSWMLVGYAGSVPMSVDAMAHPDESVPRQLLTLIAIVGFALTTDLVVEVCSTCREISHGEKFSKWELVRRFGVAAMRKIVAILCSSMVFVVVESLYGANANNKQAQAAYGDIHFKHPNTIFSNLYYWNRILGVRDT